MADIWLPGYERWSLPGVPGLAYDEPDDPKAVLHTTEGSSIDGAVSAYKAYPPQLIVDPVRRRKVQHIPLNRAGYALWNADADDSRCYQVEIVGFASQTHLWSDDTLRWLGEELARPLHEYGGVPYVVAPGGFRRDGEMPYALASASSRLRLTQAALDSFSGFLGHQHIPGDSHWDPGGLNVPKILAYAQGDPDMNIWDIVNFRPNRNQNLFDAVEQIQRNQQVQTELLAKVANNPDITPAALAAEVDKAVAKHTPTPQQVAAALLPSIEEIAERVAQADNVDQAAEVVRQLARELSDTAN
jgi:hypothetical protein